MSDPVVSVVMATYRGAALVGATIESVLAQTMGDFELVIVDDASPDDTLAVIARYTDPRIRVVAASENRGPVHTRNRALALARGRYVAALDQDDLCRPTRFARQVAYLDANPGTVLVATEAELLMDGRLRPPGPPRHMTPAVLRWMLHLCNPLVWSSTMMRGDTVRALSPFTRPEMLYAEDYDLYHRLLRLGTVARIDEPLLVYRCHAGGASQVHEARMAAHAGVVLAAAYQPWFGDAAQAAAALMLHHVGARRPVPDVATLERIAAIVGRVGEALLAGERDATARVPIARETSRLLWRLVRTGIRAGTLDIRGAVLGRPAAARLRDLRAGDLLVSRLVGGRRRQQSFFATAK